MRLTVLFITLFSCMACYAQNLTVDEMLRLKAQNIAVVEEYLSDKGWTLLSSETENADSPGKINFAYNKGKNTDTAESFLRCLYTKKDGLKIINLQLHSQDKYNSYLTAIKSLSNNLVYSNIGTDKIIKVYQGPAVTFIVKVKIKKSEASTVNIYHIFIMSNADYNIIKDTEIEALPQVVDIGSKHKIVK